MKYFSFLFPAFLMLVLPNISFAEEVDYARAVEHTNSEVLIKQSSFTEENWYTCSTSSLSCGEVERDTSITPPKTTPQYMYAYRALMPNGSQSLTRSPDGRFIAFYIPATQSRGERTFGIMDTTDLSIYTNTEKVAYWDLLTEGIRYYVFSPDSKTLVYLDDVEDETTLFKVDLSNLSGTTFKGQRLFSKTYSVADLVFKDNDSIFYIANRDSPYDWGLYELNLQTYDLKKITDNVSYADNLWLLENSNKLLFTKANENGVKPALLNLLTDSIEYFDFPSLNPLRTDGQVVTKLSGGLTGVFLLEESGWSDTLLVWLHGGPYRQASIGYHPYKSYGGYDWVLEKARQADVGVLKLDYPGSYGFGRSFAESITGNIGVVDSEKVVASIKDFATRNSYKHVYVMGNSYGGYLALKTLVDAPNTIDGAFSINGVTDWLTLLTRLDTSIFNVQFAGTVNDDNRADYQKASIYNYADKLNGQKVVLMHGGSDRTIPHSQSEGLSTYLNLIGKQHTYIKLEGEDHIFKKPESFNLLCNTTLSLLNRGKSSALCTL